MIDHLWQSTIFALAVWLLTFALRNNRAKVRHALWLAASIKFLIPFSPLLSIGRRIQRAEARAIARPVIPTAIQSMGKTFAPMQLAEITPANHSIAAVLFALWLCGAAVVMLLWCGRWMRIRAAARSSTPLACGPEHRSFRNSSVDLRECSARMEPGVFGIFRPVVLLPKGVADHLTDAQLDAILAHELCHIRRRDNLTAAIHMLVEAAFWFHPIVWWIGTRLTFERERACDEEVLRLGSQPEIYAESILKICRFYLESPLPCVAGVTGANLKSRIEEIMTRRIAGSLHPVKKLLLATAAALALILPLAIGLAQSAPERIEVASIKPSHAARGCGPRFQPGGTMNSACMTLSDLIQWAFNLRNDQISGGPQWIRSAKYDINAKPERPWTPNFENRERGRLMVQTLLKERFQFTCRFETKEMPVYALVAAKDGVKLRDSGKPVQPGDMSMHSGRGQITARKIPPTILVETLAQILGRNVTDKTGLTGNYDFDLSWTPEENEIKVPGDTGQYPIDPSGPTLFTALQEQLGLKLESINGPVEILVIDHVERPSEN